MPKKKSFKPVVAKKKTNEPYSSKRFLRDVVEVVVPAVVLFLIIHTFFLESRFVPSPSMVPTIEVQDWFLSNKTAYWFHVPDRYQIIVFKPPEITGSQQDYVKRIIGLPGESVAVHHGVVFINNKPLKEPYMSPDRAPIAEFNSYVVPEGDVFVMGDNRNDSADSREWGPLSMKSIKGQAWFRYWPLNRIGFVK